MSRPNTATSTAASAIPGKAMTTSSTRMITESTRRAEVAASAPTSPPATRASTTAPRPIVSDQRVPWTRREKMSRPDRSVPNQCSPLGPPMLVPSASGSCGVISGPNTATSASTTSSPSATQDTVFSLRKPIPGRDSLALRPRRITSGSSVAG